MGAQADSCPVSHSGEGTSHPADGPSEAPMGDPIGSNLADKECSSPLTQTWATPQGQAHTPTHAAPGSEQSLQPQFLEEHPEHMLSCSLSLSLSEGTQN